VKILVFGDKGQLGRHLLQAAKENGIDVAGADLPDCDITDAADVGNALDQGGPVTTVINAAAYTEVDNAENNKALAYAVNRDGPAHLAVACRQRGIPLIHISTDYVFDGMQIRPYRPDDTVGPQGVYACSKAAGEEAVRTQWEHHLIVRVSWLFGRYGHNFVKTMLRLGRQNETVHVVDDQIGSPTYAGDLAKTLILMADRIERAFSDWGTYHYCNQGALTWYAFARRIFAFARPYEKLAVREVIPILTAHYPTPAPRPHYSVLDCSTFDAIFEIERRPWDAALKEMLATLY
jgi:dTDP-4-dehydrorhamnose reductase